MELYSIDRSCIPEFTSIQLLPETLFQLPAPFLPEAEHISKST